MKVLRFSFWFHPTKSALVPLECLIPNLVVGILFLLCLEPVVAIFSFLLPGLFLNVGVTVSDMPGPQNSGYVLEIF